MSQGSSIDIGERLRDEAHRILKEAERRGVTLRLLGLQAVREHCPRFGHLLDEIGRCYLDLDFLGLSGQRSELKQLFAGMGYRIDRKTLVAAEGTRYYFVGPTGTPVDVFIDALDFCHRIDLRERMALDYPTIPLADLLLSKLQIVEITEKDVQDMLTLLVEHDVGERDEPDVLNVNYMAELLAADWGFYQTVSNNLSVLASFLTSCGWLHVSSKATIAGRIETLEKAIETKDKTLGWKLRSKVGKRIIWYKQVGARDSVF
ncbi:MAG TPA: hypothetical protein VF297_06880 [Pyrinomonadaceae bacterium]